PASTSLGTHAGAQRRTVGFPHRHPPLPRPSNSPAGTPGRGAGLFIATSGRKVFVVNVMGRLFMDALDDPFAAVERELASQRLAATADAIVVDVHAEATSEKMAMGHIFDGP